MLIAPKRLKVRTSNLAGVLRGIVKTSPLPNGLEKWAWSGSRDAENFWALNANSSNTGIDTNVKFGRNVPRHSPDMTLRNVSEKNERGQSRDTVNFGALNANSSKTAKDTNFIFGMRAPRRSKDIAIDKWFGKVGVVRVT